MDREVRKAQSTLALSGKAVIIFAFWGLVKSITQLMYDSGVYSQITAMLQSFEGGDENLVRIITYSTFGLFMAIDLIFRLVVGLGASAEAHGKKKSGFYVAIAVLMLLSSVLQVMQYLQEWWDGQISMDMISALVLEGTSSLILVDLIRSAIKVKKSRRETKCR